MKTFHAKIRDWRQVQLVSAAEEDSTHPQACKQGISCAGSLAGSRGNGLPLGRGDEQAGKLHKEGSGSGMEAGGGVVGHLQKGNIGTGQAQNTTDFKSLRLCPGRTLVISLANRLNEATVL